MDGTSLATFTRRRHPVVHFEIIGTNPKRLSGYYGDLVGVAGG